MHLHYFYLTDDIVLDTVLHLIWARNIKFTNKDLKFILEVKLVKQFSN